MYIKTHEVLSHTIVVIYPFNTLQTITTITGSISAKSVDFNFNILEFVFQFSARIVKSSICFAENNLSSTNPFSMTLSCFKP